MIQTLAELRAFIDAEFPVQAKVDTGPFGPNGERYMEFRSFARTRNSEVDIKSAKEMTLRNVAAQFQQYAEGRSGTLHWRIEPEEDLINSYVVLKWDENGPDRDFYTNKPCFMDRDWLLYGVYMRLLICKKPDIQEAA